jgi:hypothetical protein
MRDNAERRAEFERIKAELPDVVVIAGENYPPVVYLKSDNDFVWPKRQPTSAIVFTHDLEQRLHDEISFYFGSQTCYKLAFADIRV